MESNKSRGLGDKSIFQPLNEEYQSLIAYKQELEQKNKNLKNQLISANEKLLVEYRNSNFTYSSDEEILRSINNFKSAEIKDYEEWKSDQMSMYRAAVRLREEEERDYNRQLPQGPQEPISEPKQSQEDYNKEKNVININNAKGEELKRKLQKTDLFADINNNKEILNQVENNIIMKRQALQKSFQEIVLSNVGQILNQTEFWEKKGSGFRKSLNNLTGGFFTHSFWTTDSKRPPDAITKYKKIFDTSPLNIKNLESDANRKLNEYLDREEKVKGTEKDPGVDSDAKELTEIILKCLRNEYMPDSYSKVLNSLNDMKQRALSEKSHEVSSSMQMKYGSKDEDL